MEFTILPKIVIAGFCSSDTSKRKENFRMCGEKCIEYYMYRTDPNRPDAQGCKVWICEKHKKAAERSGYTMVPVKS